MADTKSKTTRTAAARRAAHKPESESVTESAVADIRSALGDTGAIGTGEYTSSRGITVQISGVSPHLIQNMRPVLREEWKASGKQLPDPPTYTVPSLSGPQVMQHDAQSVQEGTDADRAAWAAYLEAVGAFEAEIASRMMRLAFVRGVLTNPPEDGLWIDEQKYLGVYVPDHPIERKLHWVRTEVLGAPAEMIRLVNLILGKSGVDSEALREAEEAFLRQMAESQRAEARGLTPASGGVVPQPDVPRSQNGKGVGAKAKPVLGR